MIRDEYKKSQEIRKKSVKEIEGIKKYGERAYYAMSLKKAMSNLKTLNINFIFLSIMGLVLLIAVAVLLFLDSSLIEKIYIIISLVLVAVIFGWSIIYLLFVKKSLQNKIRKFQNIIEEIKNNEMQKQKNIYNLYNQISKNDERI